MDRKLIHVWKKRLKDSVEFIDGISRYIISAIDSKLKFSFSSCYSYLSSRNSLDLLKKLEVVCPLQIKSIQTDNGAEFLIRQCRKCIVTFS